MATIALFAIARKRREIVRKIGKGAGDLVALRRAVKHLDAAAVLLAEPRPPKRPRSRKPIAWPVRAALAQADRGLTAKEITAYVSAIRKDDPRDAKRFAILHSRVFDVLYDLEARGAVTRTRAKSMGEYVWRVAC
ncbi:MAG: hypothetical protein ABW199_12120 [Caulobacterales bacterium]